MTDCKRIFILVLLTSCLSACLSDKDDAPVPKPPELTMAEEAYARGDYEASVRYLLPLAHEGNADAQYALGYALYEGLGVPQDRMQAYFWIQESALQGNSSATMALELFEQTPNLPVNDVHSDIAFNPR